MTQIPMPSFWFTFHARPADANNWLLDLLLQGYEYKADKASLALQAVGLPHEFLISRRSTLRFSGVRSEPWR